MPTLEGSYHRLELIQSSSLVQDVVSPDLKLRFHRGLNAKIDCALFAGPIATNETFIDNIGNLVSARLTVRKNNAYGTALIDVSSTTFYSLTYANWTSNSGRQFYFDLSAIDTNQTLNGQVAIPIYFAVTITTPDRTFVAGSGFGEILESGVVSVPTPLPPALPPTTITGNLTVIGAVNVSGGTSAESSTAKMYDRGGQFYNIMAYGGKTGGIEDNLTAFNDCWDAMIAEVGYAKMGFPAGTFFFSNFPTVFGEGNDIEGAGREATRLVVANDATCAIKLGNDVSFYTGKISGLGVSRAGVSNSTSIGIWAYNYSSSVIEDVAIHNQGVGIKTGHNSAGLELNRVHIFDIVTTSLWVYNGIETFVTHCKFGRGAEAHSPTKAFFLFEGTSNDFRCDKTQLITYVYPCTTATCYWTSMASNSTGYYRFNDINVENANALMRSDSTALGINEIQFVNSRLTPNGKIFDLHANTVCGTMEFSHNPSITTAPCTIDKVFHGVFADNNGVIGGLTFSGGGGSWRIHDNIFLTDVVLTGAFAFLRFEDNVLAFNGSAGIYLVLTAVTGNNNLVWNTGSDTGIIHPTIIPNSFLDGLPLVTACAYNTSNFAVSTGVPTAVPFVLERWDTSGIHSVSSNTTRFVAPVDGFYTMSASGRFESNGTGLRKLLIFSSLVGGYIAAQTVNANASSSMDLIVARNVFQMSIGDYVELHVYHTAGVTLNLQGSDGVPAEFSIKLLR